MGKDNIITEQVGKEIAIAFEKAQGREYVPFSLKERHHGYDIRSFDPKLNAFRYIELKTSRKPHMINRWLEQHEQNCLENLEGYYIYYILDIDVQKKTGRVVVFSSEEWKKHFKKVEKHYWYSFPKGTGLDRAIACSATV